MIYFDIIQNIVSNNYFIIIQLYLPFSIKHFEMFCVGGHLMYSFLLKNFVFDVKAINKPLRIIIDR